jgi:hypothetical protein
MKALDLDSSLSARKQLAKELHYTGNTIDSAKMNVWLHKQIMTKLAPTAVNCRRISKPIFLGLKSGRPHVASCRNDSPFVPSTSQTEGGGNWVRL